MAKSLFGGSAALTGALLLGSLFFQSYPSATAALGQNKQDNRIATQTAGASLPAAEQLALAAEIEVPAAPVRVVADEDPPPPATGVAVAAQLFTATAYSLPGRTASGRAVARGLIAADARLFPMGTRVRLEAGPYTGEYVVADRGGAVRGRKIDIWMPSPHEARRFGRRPVKLTIMSYPARAAARTATR
ncbi:MAG TPA: 3D domain-containing protein [Pyrinomonadaceae bacterium]|jgi:3D (Asp-Asp-Asp) domain-containing protein